MEPFFEEVEFEADEDRKLASFSNRLVPTRIFIEALHSHANNGKIIYFHGNGGNGKSLLLTYLQKNFCRRVDDVTWQTIKEFSDKELRDRILEISATADADSGLFSGNILPWCKLGSGGVKCESIPSVMIDFGEPTYEVQPQNPFSATCHMRKMLAGKNLNFVLFDYAYVLYLSRTGNLTEREIKNVICDGTIDAMLELAKASYEFIPGSGLALKLLNRIIGSKMFLYFKQRKVDEQFLDQLRNIKSNSELENRMPYLFALDLVASMQSKDSPSRLALFFDTHEKFWLTQRDLSPLEYFRKDAWFRIMLNVLRTSERIVTVVAGRELPRWSEASKNAISADRVLTHQVGLISLADARESLENRGITDVSLREAIARFTEVEHSEVHPMYLGICADAVQPRLEKGIAISPDEFRNVVSPEKLGEEVLHRLLSDVACTLQPAIVALCVCRSFNYAIFRELAQNSLGSSGDRPVFEQILTNFSFVKKLPGGNYQIHQLVRKLIDDIPIYEKEILTNRKVLESYYRTLAINGDDSALAEAIYYANQLDAESGGSEWLITFRDALDQCRWLLCDRLSELSREFTFANEAVLAEVMHLKGKYYHRISRYEDAKVSYLSSLDQIDVQIGEEQENGNYLALRCAILNDMVDLLSYLSEHKKAEIYFQKALTAYEEEMRHPGCGASIYSEKGELLNVYGYERQRMSDKAAAEKLYVDALAVCDQAILIDRGSVDGHINKARALRRLSELKLMSDRRDSALEASSAALDCIEEALRLQPSNAKIFYQKGKTYTTIGENHNSLGNMTEAKTAFDKAEKWLDKALAIVPNNEKTLFDKGIAYNNLAGLLLKEQATNEAEAAFNKAIATLGEALAISPQDAWAHSRLATVLMSIGDLRTQESRTPEAMVFYQSAVNSIDNALKIAPNEAWMLNNKGLIYSNLGTVQSEGGELEKAIESLEAACRCFNNAISLTPQFVEAHLGKGDALRKLGQLASSLSAVEHLRQSAESYHRAAEIEPKNLYALCQEGYVFLDMVELQGIAPATALDYAAQGEKCFDKALRLNPSDKDANSFKGWASLLCGRILKAEGRSAEADIAFGEAIDRYRQIQKLDPDDENANENILWLFNQIKGTKLAAKMSAEDSRAAVAPHDLEDERRYRKPLNLSLTPVTGGEAQQFLADIFAPELPDLSGVQAVALPFYKEYWLYQYTNKTNEPYAVYYYLYKPGDAHLLDWTPDPLLEMPANDALILDQETVISYVRFLSYFTRNENGQLILVESPEDIVWHPEASEQDRTELIAHIKSLTIVNENDETFLLNGTVLIDNMLLKEDFLVPKETISVLNQINNQPMEIPKGFFIPVNDQIVCKNLKVMRSPGAEKIFETVAKAARVAVTPHDLEEERRYRVPLDLGLAPVDWVEARQFLADIFAPESQDLSEVQVADLPFCKEYRLYQYIDKSIEPVTIYYYLYKPGDVHLLNWTPIPLLKIVSNDALILDQETVISYVRFLSYFTRNNDGQLIIVESPEDIVWRPEATEQDRTELIAHIKPLTIVEEHDETFLLNGTVLIDNTLLREDFLVPKDTISVLNQINNQPMEIPKGFFIPVNDQIVRKNLKVMRAPGAEKIFENIIKAARTAVTPHDLIDERRYRVPLDIGLALMDGDEARQFLADIYAPESLDLSEVRVAVLPFYEDYRLCQYTDKSTEPSEVYYYLYKPGDARLLNWSNIPIYLLNNTGALKLTPENVIDYAKFFFYFVRGELGTFIIAEKPQDLIWLPETTAEEKIAVERLLIPVGYLGIDDNQCYVLHCTIIFKDALFSSDITVAQESIKIVDPETNEEMLQEKGQLKLVNEELLCEEQNVPIQPPPNSVKARKLAEQKARAEVGSHNLETERQYRMPMDFGLMPVSESVANRFLGDIYAPESPDQSEVQAVALPFFHRRKLFQYTDKTNEPANVYYYLYKPGDARLINWSAESINALTTAEELILEPDTVLSYVKFYHFFARGQDSQFILVEKPEDIIWLPEATTKDRAELNRHLIQLTYLGMDDKYYLLKETVLVKNMLFCQELRIPSESMTVINPDSNLPMELKQGMVIPGNEQLLAKDLKVAVPDSGIRADRG